MFQEGRRVSKLSLMMSLKDVTKLLKCHNDVTNDVTKLILSRDQDQYPYPVPYLASTGPGPVPVPSTVPSPVPDQGQ